MVWSTDLPDRPHSGGLEKLSDAVGGAALGAWASMGSSHSKKRSIKELHSIVLVTRLMVNFGRDRLV